MQPPSEEDQRITDSQHLQGLCIDLLHSLHATLGFSYEVHLVADGNYGGQDPRTGRWNGIMGEIIEGVSASAILETHTAWA